MQNEIEVYPINPNYKLREVVFECFKSIGHELPITGGWGNSKADAIIIDKNDPVVTVGLPFDGVSIEYLIVEKLIYFDLIIMRAVDDRYSGIKWQLNIQRLVTDGDKRYDQLDFNVSAHTDKDFEMLKGEYDAGLRSGNFNQEEHMKKHNGLLKHYRKDIWFDITSFYKK